MRSIFLVALALALPVVAACGNSSSSPGDVATADANAVVDTAPTDSVVTVVSSPVTVPVDSSTIPAADTKEWPQRWCDVKLGMTPTEVVAAMGQNPTEAFSDQLAYQGFQYVFSVFFNADGKVMQLDYDPSRLTADDKVVLTCPETRR